MKSIDLAPQCESRSEVNGRCQVLMQHDRALATGDSQFRIWSTKFNVHSHSSRFWFFSIMCPPERPKRINIIPHCQIMTPQNLGRLKCSWWTSNLFVGNFCHHLNCFDLNLIKWLEFGPFSKLFHESKGNIFHPSKFK